MSCAAGALLLLTAGCAKNYEGDGNSFTIRGPVQEVGDNSITILPVDVVDAEGKSIDWFEADDATRVHDNYNNEWCNQKDVGEVFDTAGDPQGLADVQEGEWVELQGSIRESKETCGKYARWEHRPVFETATEQPR